MSRKRVNIDFDSMDGSEFEEFCSELLRSNGFIGVSTTKRSGDRGIDILARKGGKKYAIQCKRYSKNVGNKAVQEAYAGCRIYGADIPVVMTNSYFTKQAQEDASSLNVFLWDRNTLSAFIASSNSKEGIENIKKFFSKIKDYFKEHFRKERKRCAEEFSPLYKDYNMNKPLIQEKVAHIQEEKIEEKINFKLKDTQEEKFIEKLKSRGSKKESKTDITEEDSVAKENDVAPICKEQYGDSEPLTLPSFPEKSTADAAKVEARVEVDPSTGEESEEGAFAISADTIFENAGIDRNMCSFAKTEETKGTQATEQETPVPVQENIDSDEEPKSTSPAQSNTINTPPPPEPFIPEKKYEFPPIDLLEKPVQGKGANEWDLKETAVKLQNMLRNFGVRVAITNISCGPAVTQYELQLEKGIRISQIKKLSDDIRLSLAATDIRIEAPIPGKAAVGIEVPNKENSPVILRELLESPEFKKHKSELAFAVGKNISGQIVVSDIAKMPHMLIAGATGSGKSVFINNIIMSILYKSDPKDIKFIMISPNNCGLSIYNGIPHLLIPVITDPEKASAALSWAVAEIADRYRKFAVLSVRDLNGYNEKVAALKEPEAAFPRLPQIVIIVDDLADLMISSYSMNIEDAISIISGKGGIAEIHLVIATQRPSVNVITGRIKANIPSRISFGVFSSIDSMVILDEKGAEKISRVGDMMFKQRGNMNLKRIHGAYVSDKEIFAVVDFLRKQEEPYAPIEQKEKPEEKDFCVTDELFFDAGRMIIEKQKASIGMLQRIYKIGFNRAARIMDQLTEIGVVDPEEGTKPRRILMSMEQFERYIEEHL